MSAGEETSDPLRALERERNAVAVRRAITTLLHTHPGASAYGPVVDLLCRELDCTDGLLGRIEDAGVLLCTHHRGEEETRIAEAQWPAAWTDAWSGGTTVVVADGAVGTALVPLASRRGAQGILVFREIRRDPAEAGWLLEAVRPDLSESLEMRVLRQKHEYLKLTMVEDAYRLAEERLRAVFQESQDMMLTLDERGTITSVNRAALRLLGYQQDHQLVGRPERELWATPEDHGVYLSKLQEQGYLKDFEVILVRADGSTIFGLESATLLRNRDGSPAEIHATVKDITERIRSEQTLWRMNVELAEANQKLKESHLKLVQQEKLASIGQIAAGVAHEINNPLGFVKGNHGVLRKYLAAVRRLLEVATGVDDPRIAEAIAANDIDYILGDLDAIMGQTEDGLVRITDIVQNLRSFSRVDSAESFGLYDLNKGVENTLLVARNEVKYVATPSMELGEVPPIECVGGEINQVLLNLVVNAAQAIRGQGRKEPGRIVVRTRCVEEWVRVEVEDDGPGIPPELHARIFDPFFTTKPAGQGTGLGLSISADIVVQKHGGRLSVSSEPGNGSTFLIELPVRHAPSAG